MAASIASLGIDVTARTAPFVKGMDQATNRVRRFSGDIRRQSAVVGAGSGRLTAMGGAVRGVGTALAGAGITIGLASIGAALVKAGTAAEAFQRKMRNSLAIMGDVSGQMQGQMRDAAFQVAKTTQFSASQSAEAYFFLASAGLDAQQSVAAMPQVAKFAQAGMFDLALATDLATDAQSALGLTVKDSQQNLANLTRVTDVLTKANTIANAKSQEFSESLTNKAGAALRIVNKDIEEGVAVLAAFADQGLKGAEAGTALNIVLRDWKTQWRNNTEEFKRMKVEVFDAAGQMRNVADIVGDMERALAGLSPEAKAATLATLGFTDKSVAFSQMLLGTSDKIRGYEESLRSAGGMTDEVANKQMTSIQIAWARFTGELSEFLTKNGQVLDAVAGTISMLAKLVEGVNNVIDAFSQFGSLPRVKFGDFHSFLFPEEEARKAIKSANQMSEPIIRAADALALAEDGAESFANEVKSIADPAEEAAKKLEELKKAGQSLAESLRTPAEAFKAEVIELKDLLNAKAISAEIFERGLERAREQLRGAIMETRELADIGKVEVGAVTRGTVAGFSAVQAGRDVMNNVHKVTEDQLKVQEEIRDLQKESLDLARRQKSVTVRQVSL